MPLGKSHIDRMLTNVSVSYQQPKFIAERVYLPFPSDKQSDLYPVYGTEQYNLVDDDRAPGTEAKSGPSWRYSTTPFYCGGHARKDSVPGEKNENQDPPLNLTMTSTKVLTRQVGLRQEVNLVNKIKNDLTGTSLVNLGAAGGGLNTPWNNDANDPITMILQQKDIVASACGEAPNVLALGAKDWTAVRNNAKVKSRITGAPNLAASLVSLAQFAELCELDEVIVGRAQYNSANAGQAASLSYIWDTIALLFVRPESPGLETMSLGYQPMWTKALGTMTGLEQVPGIDGIGNQFVEQYWWQPKKSWEIEVHKYYDQNTVAAAAGCLFTGVRG